MKSHFLLQWHTKEKYICILQSVLEAAEFLDFSQEGLVWCGSGVSPSGSHERYHRLLGSCWYELDSMGCERITQNVARCLPRALYAKQSVVFGNTYTLQRSSIYTESNAVDIRLLQNTERGAEETRQRQNQTASQSRQYYGVLFCQKLCTFCPI